jgi:hypothetical protein
MRVCFKVLYLEGLSIQRPMALLLLDVVVYTVQRFISIRGWNRCVCPKYVDHRALDTPS